MGAVIKLTGRGSNPPRPMVHSTLTRLSPAASADWMMETMAECRRHNIPSPALVDFLKRTGLLNRCVFLANDEPGGPLRFRYIGDPTIAVMGRAWARRNLHRPVADNDGSDFGDAMATSYEEAIGSGAPVFNRIDLTGSLAQPMTYMHSLFGWRAADGRRAVLSCVQL